jgi:hypothetical protein
MLNPRQRHSPLVSLPTSVALHLVHKAIETADALEEIDLASATTLRNLANSLLSGLLPDLRSKVASVRPEVRETYMELDKFLDELAT